MTKIYQVRLTNHLAVCLTACLLILLSVSSNQAKAATPISDQMAQKFYGQCLENSKKDGTMSEQSAQVYCECTGKTMQQNMSVEDIQAMSGQDQAARNAINKVVTDVNGPCMAIPLHDKVYNKCMTDVGKLGMCECLASGISLELSKQTQSMMRTLLANNPNMYDPMGELMEMPEYKQTERKIAMSCAMQQSF
ncbi:MAG: hypothetical protein RBR86_02315 [Pseudobdellovibrionaceae bacterium]|jgi:hypothetical protein|nr:hypothetical protein [Pseudobdellovibrionaceae bacterium]